MCVGCLERIKDLYRTCLTNLSAFDPGKPVVVRLTFIVDRFGSLFTALAACSSGKDDPVRLLLVKEVGEILDGGIFEGEDVRCCANFGDLFVTGGKEVTR